MTIKQLRDLGFNESLAKAYLTLLEHGKLTPPELARLNKETRPNAYSLLNKLAELKLASKHPTAKKALYRAENPVALEKLMQKQRDEAVERERLTSAALPGLLNLYHLGSEGPGVRMYQGKKGITDIFNEQLRERKPIWYIRSLADIDFFGFGFMRYLRNLAPEVGIPRRVITPDNPLVPVNQVESDRQKQIERTWMTLDDYTAPVEWAIFGDKVSVISFGKEAVGMIIDSPQIAESLRQLFSLLDEGLRRRPNYHTFPKLAAYTTYDDYLKQHPDEKKGLVTRALGCGL